MRFDTFFHGLLRKRVTRGDPWLYMMAHRLFNVARGLVQTACTTMNVFFSSTGPLTISGSKSEVMLFTRKYERPPILVRIGSYVLPQTTCLKYLGIYFSMLGCDGAAI
jgi:hypothetical protein